MPVRRVEPGSGTIHLRPGVISMDVLRRVSARLAEYGQLEVSCDGYQVDSVDELADVPSAPDLAPVRIEARVSERLGFVILSGSSPSVQWNDSDSRVAQAATEDIARIVNTALGPRWRRWLSRLLLCVAVIGVAIAVAVARTDVSVSAPLVAALVTVLPATPGVLLLLGETRWGTLRVRVREPSGLGEQIRERWVDWVAGGLVVGVLLLIADRWL